MVQVGGVRGVGDEGGVQGLRGGAGRLQAPRAKQRSEQRRGVGQRLATVARRAVSAGGGSPPHVRAANDGPLEERGQSEHNTHTQLKGYSSYPGGNSRKKSKLIGIFAQTYLWTWKRFGLFSVHSLVNFFMEQN